jgi:hypothetical protein
MILLFFLTLMEKNYIFPILAVLNRIPVNLESFDHPLTGGSMHQDD